MQASEPTPSRLSDDQVASAHVNALHFAGFNQLVHFGAPKAVNFAKRPQAEDALDGVRGVEALLARLLSAVTSVEAIAERAAEDATPRPGPQAKAIRIEARRGAVSELGPMFLALTGKRPTVRTSQAMGHPAYGPWYDFTVTALEPLFGPNEAKAGLIHTLRKVARGMKDEPDAWHVHYLPDNSPE